MIDNTASRFRVVGVVTRRNGLYGIWTFTSRADSTSSTSRSRTILEFYNFPDKQVCLPRTKTSPGNPPWKPAGTCSQRLFTAPCSAPQAASRARKTAAETARPLRKTAGTIPIRAHEKAAGTNSHRPHSDRGSPKSGWDQFQSELDSWRLCGLQQTFVRVTSRYFRRNRRKLTIPWLTPSGVLSDQGDSTGAPPMPIRLADPNRALSLAPSSQNGIQVVSAAWTIVLGGLFALVMLAMPVAAQQHVEAVTQATRALRSLPMALVSVRLPPLPEASETLTISMPSAS